jgi:hypothetical protein
MLAVRAGVAKLVDAPGLGPDAVRHAGSNPVSRTIPSFFHDAAAMMAFAPLAFPLPRLCAALSFFFSFPAGTKNPFPFFSENGVIRSFNKQTISLF